MRSWIALALPVGLALAALAADSPNLVANPSLEGPLGEGGVPEGWYRFSQPQDAFKFSVVPGGRTGEKALLLEGAGEYAGVLAAQVPLEDGKEYAARGWVKVEGDAATLCTVKLDYFTDGGEYLASSYYEGHLRPTPGAGWRPIALVSRRSDAPAAKKIGVAVALVGRGKAWFDDLEFVSRPAPPENLLRNGSMEDVVGDRPYGYQSFFAEGGSGTLTFGTQDPKDGWYTLHKKGDSQWCVSLAGRVPIEKGKTYTLRGWARAKAGTAQVKIDYFKGEEWIGQSVSDDQSEDAWRRLAVISELGMFPEATHLAGAVVGAGGQYDAQFDGLTLTAR